MRYPSLDSLNCFLEAARYLNFRAAAKAVALTPAALGQRIRQLEELLGTRLFHRTTREVVLTESGLSLIPYAENALQSAESCIRAGRGELGPTPMELTLGTRHELGMSWIMPMIDQLEHEHPGLTLNLYFGSGPDLMIRVRTLEIDCAVSSSQISDAKIDFARLHREDYVFVGTPNLLKQNPLETQEQAQNHVLYDTQTRLPLLSYYRGAPGSHDDLQFKSIRCYGTIEAIRQRVLQGAGVAVLPLYLVQPDLDAGDLQQIFPKTTLPFDYFRLVFRADDPRKGMYQSLALSMMQHPLK